RAHQRSHGIASASRVETLSANLQRGSVVNDDLDPAQEQLLANAVADYLDLKARGLAANIDNYCARYPQMGTLLRTELETVDQIDRTLADATDVATNAEELPARLSGHRILGELGSGGMGRVLL